MPAIGPYAYPFDPSGVAATNLVTNEAQIVTAVNSNEYHIVVPNFAPFFRASLAVLNGGTMTPLVEGVDFIFTHKYIEATINTAIPVYGSITLLNKSFSGVILFSQYQTVGGQWTLSTTQINQILSDKLLNPRITTWEQLGNAPEHFPVTNHLHVDPEELIGMPELVTAVENINITLAGMELTVDYDTINAYADSKIQNSLSPVVTNKAPSVQAVVDALNNLQVGVHIGSTPPPFPIPKQLWWRSDLGRMFIYYQDGDSIQWVETSPGTIRENTAFITVSAVQPTSPNLNDMWLKTPDNILYVYYNNGVTTSWVEITAGSGSGDGVSVGTVIHSFADNPDAGFLHCRGDLISKATYPDLFTAIGHKFAIGGDNTSPSSTTFRLPNLQGMFLRGLDIDGTVDPGRTLGDKQKGSLIVTDSGSAAAVASTKVSGVVTGYSNITDAVGYDDINSSDYPNVEISGRARDSSNTLPGGNEAVAGATRPVNVSVNYFIKAFSDTVNGGSIDVGQLANDVSDATWKLGLELDINSPMSEIELLLPATAKMIRISLNTISYDAVMQTLKVYMGSGGVYTGVNYNGARVSHTGVITVWGAGEVSGNANTEGFIELMRVGNSNKWGLSSNMEHRAFGSITLPGVADRIKLFPTAVGAINFSNGFVTIWYL